MSCQHKKKERDRLTHKPVPLKVFSIFSMRPVDTKPVEKAYDTTSPALRKKEVDIDVTPQRLVTGTRTTMR